MSDDNEHKILFVDDEESIIFSIRNNLDQFNIETFISPNDAFLAALENEYDIIVTDYRMPEMTGLDFLLKVKEEYKKINHSFYSILLTAYADKDILERAINKNLINKLVEKPLDIDYLKKILDEALIISKKERKKEEHQEQIETENIKLKAKIQKIIEKIVSIE